MKLDHIILHIGPHKTGSTAIQTTCDRNRSRLRELGILYPCGLVNANASTAWHPELASFFYEDPRQFIHNQERLAYQGRDNLDEIKREDQAFMQSLLAQIEQAKCRTLIFSYEGFPAIEEQPLIKMRDFLLTLANKITVVAYCRPPLSLVSSAISQLVKTGRGSHLAATEGIHRYQGFGEWFVTYLGRENVMFRKFSARDMPEGNVVLDFLSVAGLTMDEIKSLDLQQTVENPSLSAEAILLGDAIISAHPLPAVGNTFPTDFEAVLSAIRGQKYTLSTLQADAILADAQPHSDYLAAAFDIHFDAETKLIDDHPKLFSAQTIADVAEQIYVLREEVKAAQKQVLVLEQQLLEVSRQPDRPRLEPRTVTTNTLILLAAILREGRQIKRGQLINFDVDFFIPNAVKNLEWSIHLVDSKGQCAFSVSSTMLSFPLQSLVTGSYRVSHHLIADLPVGEYRVGFAFTEILNEGVRELAWQDAMCEFEVLSVASKPFAGYAYVPTQMSFSTTNLALQERLISHPLGKIIATSPLSTMPAGQQVSLAVAVSNHSQQHWLGDTVRPVSLCYHWLNAAGEMLIFEGFRTAIPPTGIAAESTLVTEMLIDVPVDAGRYILVLTLLQDYVGWFENLGFDVAKLAIQVE